jgi:SAM-dependent methyltransferase
MQIHWEMLSDYKRCTAYYQAMMDFNVDVRGKVVLDVGCGTGILSLYAAMAGAKKVYAVDASGIVTQARQVIKKNGYQDVIQIINGKIEEITLPVDTVDVIVSEWMGYFLFCESIVEAVLFARDKWLSPRGTIFPCEANLYLAPCVSEEYYEEKVTWFRENLVDGVDVSVLEPWAAEEFTKWCLRCHDLQPEEILTQPETIAHVDLYTATCTEVRNWEKSFQFKITGDQHVSFKWKHHPKALSVQLACSANNWTPVPMSVQGGKWKVALWLKPGRVHYKFIVDGEWMYDIGKPIEQDRRGNINNVLTVIPKDHSYIHGFGSWFDVVFKGSDRSKEPVVLTTDPRTGYQTCWRQDLCLYKDPIKLNAERVVCGDVNVDRHDEYHRHFAITISAHSGGPISTQDWTV